MEELQLGWASQGWKISWSRNEWRPPAKSGSVRIKICEPIRSVTVGLRNRAIASRKPQLAAWAERVYSCSPAVQLILSRCPGTSHSASFDIATSSTVHSRDIFRTLVSN